MIKFKLSRKFQNILMIILLVLGIGILVYPDLANWWHANRHDAFLQEYNENVARMAETEIEYELERARLFNSNLSGIHIEDPFMPGSGAVISAEYYSILNFNGIMGWIEIPKINVNLPIRHGTSSQTLAIGAGHMENTPFPIGGYGNHSIITAHTGMLNMKLFNDLILLRVGDEFFVEVLGHRIAYEVYQIDEVYPHEVETLVSDKHRDLITLVTCTPYGINTHRLLVRGTRIEYIPNMANEIESITAPISLRLLIVIVFSVFFLMIILFYWGKRLQAAKERNFDEYVEREYQNWKRREVDD